MCRVVILPIDILPACVCVCVCVCPWGSRCPKVEGEEQALTAVVGKEGVSRGKETGMDV